MNAKKSIIGGSFVADLENMLLTTDAGVISFDLLKSQLWDLLCCLNENYLQKLHSELQLEYRKNNIGNLQYKTIEKLGIGYLLN